jgi:hypothetical protein
LEKIGTNMNKLIFGILLLALVGCSKSETNEECANNVVSDVCRLDDCSRLTLEDREILKHGASILCERHNNNSKEVLKEINEKLGRESQ